MRELHVVIISIAVSVITTRIYMELIRGHLAEEVLELLAKAAERWKERKHGEGKDA